MKHEYDMVAERLQLLSAYVAAADCEWFCFKFQSIHPRNPF